ncbi:MAG: Gfo/Idh/MocA family oxidoreductase [Dehalococcoidia bacterium]|nr:Gfo/Idh/MocA family oxidoreductase [Dehalococcoidia bacterium]
MSKPVAVAVVGYGYWGPNLLRNFRGVAGSRVLYCCDLDDKLLDKVRSQYPDVQTTTRYADVLQDPAVDAVVLATPARSHYPLAREALSHGKHVLVEKPLALNIQDAEGMIRLAQEHKRLLMVGHSFEYNPAVLKIKELLTAGELGDVFYIYSTRVNLGRIQQDLNALWSIAPHDISILLYLLDAMPLEVRAQGGSYLSKGIEDVVFLLLRFPGNVIAHVHASWLDPSKVRRMTIVGSRRMVVYDDVDNEAKLKMYDKGIVKGGEQVYGEFQMRIRSGDIYVPRIDLTEPLHLECAHFVECVRSGTRPRTDGENGLRVVRVLEAAQQSLQRQGAPVEIAALSGGR